MSWFRKGSCSPKKTDNNEIGDELIAQHLAIPESETLEEALSPANQTPVKTPESAFSGPTLFYGWSSERGARRRNEDYCSASGDSLLFAISDGIGGGPHGDVMSRISVKRAIEAYGESGDLEDAFYRADELASGVSRLLGEGDGATLLLAAYDRGAARLDLLSAGDTLAYRLRAGELSLLCYDEGRFRGNALEKAVGWGEVDPDRVSSDVLPGDRFLLCTDGVWEPLGEERLAELLAKAPTAPWAAALLCEEAAKVGTDNATAICIFVEGVQNDDRNLWSADWKETSNVR